MPEDRDFFLIFVRPLNRLGIVYMVTGSAASMAYGEPRVTLDIDVVLELTTPQIALLLAAFPPESFYCPSRDVIAIETERSSRGHFNLIHMETGFKADCYPVGNDPLHRWAMARRRRVELLGEPVMLAPPEYVIVRKLEYFQEGGSDKHVRDIRGMLEVSGELIDAAALDSMIRERNLGTAWQRVHELRM
jgi:hypothetical protein